LKKRKGESLKARKKKRLPVRKGKTPPPKLEENHVKGAPGGKIGEKPSMKGDLAGETVFARERRGGGGERDYHPASEGGSRRTSRKCTDQTAKRPRKSRRLHLPSTQRKGETFRRQEKKVVAVLEGRETLKGGMKEKEVFRR